MVEMYGRVYGREPGLIWVHLVAKNMANLDKPSPTKLEATKKACCGEYLLCMFLQGADQMKYYQLKNELVKDMTKSSNNYPKSKVEALHLLNNYKGLLRMMKMRESDGEGLAFVQRAAAR